MATVPRYVAQTTPNVQDGPGFHSAPGADAFGAGIGKGLEQLGAAADELGDAYAAHAIQMQNQDNSAEADELLTKGMLGLNDINYGDNGFYTKQQKAAVDSFGDAKKSVIDLKETLANSASNSAVKKLFDSGFRPQVIYNLQGMSSHYAGERKKYQENVFIGKQDALADSTALNYDNEGMRNEAINQALHDFSAHGIENGQPLEQTWKQFSDWKNKMYAKGIGMRALHDPEGAQAEADLHAEDLGPEAYLSISHGLLPSINATKLQDFVDANKFGSVAGVSVTPFTNAAAAADSIMKSFPDAIITSTGPAKSAAAKAARVPGSYHELPSGSQAVDFVRPNVSLAQAKADAEATYGGLPGVKIIAEGPGAKHSTGPHIHIQWEKTTTGPMSPLAIGLSEPEQEAAVKDRAEQAFPGQPLLQKQAVQQWKKTVTDAKTEARYGKQDAFNNMLEIVNTDIENGATPNLQAYLKNPTFLQSFRSPFLTEADRNSMMAKINSASRTPHKTSPEEQAEYFRLKGLAVSPSADMNAQFLNTDIPNTPGLKNNLGFQKELQNLQLRMRSKDPKDINAPLSHAMALPDISKSMQVMGLVWDRSDPEGEASANTSKFIAAYKQEIDTYIAVNNKRPSDQDLRHMFNSLATLDKKGWGAGSYMWEYKDDPKHTDQYKGATAVIPGVPNDKAQQAASWLRSQGRAVSPQAVQDVYNEFLAAGGK